MQPQLSRGAAEAKHQQCLVFLVRYVGARVMPANYANRLNAIGFRLWATFPPPAPAAIEFNAN